MTRDDLLAQLRDEMLGLLLQSFAAAKSQGDWVKDGRLITQQLHRGNDLFARLLAAARLPAGEVKPPEPQSIAARGRAT